MVTEKQRFLVPLDGSELAEAALPYAEAIAHLLGGSLHLLAVAEREPGGPFALAPEIREQLARGQRQGMADYLATVAKGLRDRGVVADTETVETIDGHAAEEILTAASRNDAGMVVMATHGRGGFQRLLVGSVADKVMRGGCRPTLLISPRENTAAERPAIQLRRVAVPLDGSSLAEAALAPAAALAAAVGARLVLIRVQGLAISTTMAYEYVPDLSAIDAELEHQAQQYLLDMQKRVPEGVASDFVLLRGDPTTTLADYLNKDAVDLVVMSTHGRGGMRRLAMGSTADRLVRLGLPVLLIRTAEQPSESTVSAHEREVVAR